MVDVHAMWSCDRKHSDRERWICIYPAFINNRKTLAEGRIIPKDKSVDNPTPQEIRDVLVAAGFKVGVENKVYCKEKSKEMIHRGRIRIQLKNDNGDQIHKDFPTRKSVLLFLGIMIPKLKSRSNNKIGHEQTSIQVNNNKKKGKGRR